jgi:hypothetical protein
VVYLYMEKLRRLIGRHRHRQEAPADRKQGISARV